MTMNTVNTSIDPPATDRTGSAVLTPEYVPDNYFQVLDLESVFPRRAPLEVDLGCGDGSFLSALAQRTPGSNFLGLERLQGRVRSAGRKIAQQNLGNARIFRIESSYAVAYMLPPDSVSAFYLLFPDPWPKRRHQHRRIVTGKFLEAIYRALAPDGSFVIATDDHDYFEAIQQRAIATGKFVEASASDFNLPTTTFEKHFLRRGLKVHRLVLRKVSPVK